MGSYKYIYKTGAFKLLSNKSGMLSLQELSWYMSVVSSKALKFWYRSHMNEVSWTIQVA